MVIQGENPHRIRDRSVLCIYFRRLLNGHEVAHVSRGYLVAILLSHHKRRKLVVIALKQESGIRAKIETSGRIQRRQDVFVDYSHAAGLAPAGLAHPAQHKIRLQVNISGLGLGNARYQR